MTALTVETATRADTTDYSWRSLYRIAGWATTIMAVLVPIQIVVYVVWPPPNTVIGWFTLLQTNRLAGLLDLDLLLIVDMVLMIPLYLALYAALRRSDQSLMALATVLGLISIGLYLASNAAFAMLAAGNGYAAATSEVERAVYLAAGQAMIAGFSQSTAFHMYYILGATAPIIISIVMLRTADFSRAIAYLGILGNALGLGLYLPAIGVYISVFSVVFLWAWYILLARRFFQLGAIPDRAELARRLLGAGRRFSPERDTVAELIEARSSEG